MKMKKSPAGRILCVAIICVLLLTLSLSAFAKEVGNEVSIPYKTGISIDGTVTAEEWGEPMLSGMGIDETYAKKDGGDASFECWWFSNPDKNCGKYDLYLTYDESYFYLAVVVKDTTRGQLATKSDLSQMWAGSSAWFGIGLEEDVANKTTKEWVVGLGESERTIHSRFMFGLLSDDTQMCFPDYVKGVWNSDFSNPDNKIYTTIPEYTAGKDYVIVFDGEDGGKGTTTYEARIPWNMITDKTDKVIAGGRFAFALEVRDAWNGVSLDKPADALFWGGTDGISYGDTLSNSYVVGTLQDPNATPEPSPTPTAEPTPKPTKTPKPEKSEVPSSADGTNNNGNTVLYIILAVVAVLIVAAVIFLLISKKKKPDTTPPTEDDNKKDE